VIRMAATSVTSASKSRGICLREPILAIRAHEQVLFGMARSLHQKGTWNVKRTQLCHFA
jgi:hypothetical protein